MIIDCHGHYTTAPAPHQQFRDAQLARLAALAAGTESALPPPAPGAISDDAIRESIEANQLKLLRERGTDLPSSRPRRPGWSTTSPTRPPRGPGPGPATILSTG
jgi:4-oxalmesaconate hydratase